jgi:hypothetical protein
VGPASVDIGVTRRPDGSHDLEVQRRAGKLEVTLG